MEKEYLKEIGKHLLNVAVAIIVFAIIQPAVSGKFNLLIAIISIVVYVVILILGAYLIRKGEGEKK